MLMIQQVLVSPANECRLNTVKENNNYPFLFMLNTQVLHKTCFTQDTHEEAPRQDQHIAWYRSLEGEKVHWFACTTRNYSFGFIVAKKEEAKAGKLRSLINAISKRCWGLKKSIWQFVKLPLRGSSPPHQRRLPCQQCTLSEIKDQREPKGRDVDDSSQKATLW